MKPFVVISRHNEKKVRMIVDPVRHGDKEIEENRFGVEPETAAKVAKTKVRIFEAGVSYYRCTDGEGKKIGGKDGFQAQYAS